MIGDASCTTYGFTPAKTTSTSANEAAARTAATATIATADVLHDIYSDRTGRPGASSFSSYSSRSWSSSFFSCCTKPVQATYVLLKVLFWKPVRNILQRWRLSLASLLFFTIFLTDNFGLSTSLHVDVKTRLSRSVPPPHGHPSPNTNFHNNNRHRHHSSSSSSASPSSSSYWQPMYGSYSTYWNLSEFFYSNIVNITVNNNPGILTSGSVGSFPSSSLSCLVSYNISRDICDESPVKERERIMRRLSLVFCGSGYPLFHLIGDSCKITGTTAECRACFDPIEQLDRNVHSMFCHFEEILAKADCLTNYSTHWNCNDCKVSKYRTMVGWIRKRLRFLVISDKRFLRFIKLYESSAQELHGVVIAIFLSSPYYLSPK